MNDGEHEWRSELTSEQRVHPARLGIDPGFVNHRKVQAVVGQSGIDEINRMVAALPPSMPDYMREVQIDHIYTNVLIAFCSVIKIKTLGELLSDGRGTLFSSIEQIGPCAEVFEPNARAISTITKPGFDKTAELHYTTSRVRSDTTKSELHSGARLAVIAQLHHVENDRLVFYPLVMGAPWLYADDDVLPSAEWHSFDFFHVFVEDIDEFAQVKAIEKPQEWQVMRDISERAFKTCMTEILGDELSKDWGGETSDHFTPHLNLGGHRVPAAFLLKGPSQWGPMRLNSLGKNNDQIVRLSKEPAQLLVVQHCHDITAPVHDTLRAFAVQPGSQRRYCLIDGRDSLWLLMAYGKVDRALELTRAERARRR